MEEQGLSAFICFHSDQHNSEYIAPCDERIAYISGFTGSNGLCVVTQTEAKMWTDGRYYLQAERQLEAGWQMMKMEAGVTSWFEFVKSSLEANQVIGIDYSQYPAGALQARADFFQKAGLTIKSVPNLVDSVWGDERPPRPVNPVFELKVEFSGKTSMEKQNQIAEILKNAEFEALLITTLDDICWLTNLRGTDISYNPVFFSYALFYPKRDASESRILLFINDSKLANVADHIEASKITIAPYESIEEKLTQYANEGVKIGVHVDTCNAQLNEILRESAVKAENTVKENKCHKNETEQQGMRNANVRDCAAIMKYFAYLEEELRKEDHAVTEYTGARYLDELRTRGQYHQGPSFDTISSIGPNGAVIHYKPEQDTCLPINNREIYLLDSGGQYLDGTCDITRTTQFGGCEPTAFQKEAYTRVLLGNLDLERVVWPQNTTISGGDMDILARKNLWEVGLDYKHGTGHGVGSFLCVHEGPYGVSRGYKKKWIEGMCTSNEPGFYKDGEFGIRIENVIMCVKHPEHEGYYKWENLTVAPYARMLIDKDLLSPRDVRFIDAYHARCLEALTPMLEDDARALDYVRRACAPL